MRRRRPPQGSFRRGVRIVGVWSSIFRLNFMDTVFFYRMIDSVRQSLEAAGHRGFSLSFADDPDAWFDLDYLFEYLEEIEHEPVPFLWEGKPLPEFDTLRVGRVAEDVWPYRHARNGIAVAHGDVAVAVLDVIGSDAFEKVYLIVGEQTANALRKFLADYDAYARRRSRERGWITVVGGKPIRRPGGLRWEDLILPPEVREDLRSQVDRFFLARGEFRRLGLPYRRGLLLTGPPGNGKTTILRVIASERPEPIILFQRRSDEPRDRLDEAFERAFSLAPAILCFEDIDSLFQEEGTLSHFLNRLDGLAPTEALLVLATTNHPEDLDEALRARQESTEAIMTDGWGEWCSSSRRGRDRASC